MTLCVWKVAGEHVIAESPAEALAIQASRGIDPWGQSPERQPDEVIIPIWWPAKELEAIDGPDWSPWARIGNNMGDRLIEAPAHVWARRIGRGWLCFSRPRV